MSVNCKTCFQVDVVIVAQGLFLYDFSNLLCMILITDAFHTKLAGKCIFQW